MKYSPKMSLSGPAKPLFTWAQLQKQVEDNAKRPKMFPSKPKSMAWDDKAAVRAQTKRRKEYQAYRKNLLAAEAYQQKKAEVEARNAARKAAYESSVTGRVTGLLGNAFSDVKDVVKSPFILGKAAVTGAWDNGTDVGADFQGLKNFGVEAAKATYDSYDELGAVSHWGAAVSDTVDAAKRGDIGDVLGGLGSVVRSLNPVEQLYNTATDSNFTQFGKQVYEHPVFYAMDAAPGAGAIGRSLGAGAKIMKVAERVPVARAVVDAKLSRGFAYMLHNTKEMEGSRKAMFTKSVARLKSRTDQFVLFQAVHALDPEMEIRLRKAAVDARDLGIAYTKTDIAESAILKEVATEVGEKYRRFVDQFGKPYQRIFEKYRRDGNFSEFDSEVKALKQRIDKDLHRVADAYDTNALAYLDDLKHRGLDDALKTELRTRGPQMELTAFKRFDEIKKMLGADSAHLLDIKSLGWGEDLVGYLVREGDEWAVRIIDNKGRTLLRAANPELQNARWRAQFLKKNGASLSRTKQIEAEYYTKLFEHLDGELGNNNFKPLYYHHQDRGVNVPRDNLTPHGDASAGASAQYRTDYKLWREDRVARDNAAMQAYEYTTGLNNFMKGKMLNALIDAGRAGTIKNKVRIVTDVDDLPKHDRMGGFKDTIISTGSPEWSTWEHIIFAARENIRKWNRENPDNLIPEIPDPKSIHSLVIDKSFANYIKRMTGIEKDAGSFLGKVTQYWKFGVLSMRPAFVVNNVVGNQILGMLHDPMVIREQVWNAIGRFHKNTARDLRGNYRFLGENFSDALETFGHTEKFDFGRFDVERGRYTKNGALNGAMRTFQTVANAGFKASMIHEESLRAALLIRGLRRDARIKQYMKADRLPDVDGSTKITRAWEKLVNEDKAYADSLRADLVKGTNITMGNYSFFSPMERRIKNVIPFYSWYRHIMKVAAREYTGKGAPLYVAMAQVAKDYPELADYPSFTENFIPFQKDLPGSAAGENGRKRYLDMANMNPFATVPEVLAAVATIAGTVTGVGVKPGQGGGEVLSLVNPLITAPLEVWSGRDLRTGANVDSGSIPARILMKLPPAELIKRGLTDTYDPLKNYDANNPDTWQTPSHQVSTKGVKPSAYSKSFSSALYRYLGLPIQDIDPEQLAALGKRLKSEQESRKYRIDKLPDKPASMLTDAERAAKKSRNKDILDVAYERGLPVPDFYWQRQRDKGPYGG